MSKLFNLKKTFIQIFLRCTCLIETLNFERSTVQGLGLIRQPDAAAEVSPRLGKARLSTEVSLNSLLLRAHLVTTSSLMMEYSP